MIIVLDAIELPGDVNDAAGRRLLGGCRKGQAGKDEDRQNQGSVKSHRVSPGVDSASNRPAAVENYLLLPRRRMLCTPACPKASKRWAKQRGRWATYRAWTPTSSSAMRTRTTRTKWVDGLHAYLKTRVPEFLPHSGRRADLAGREAERVRRAVDDAARPGQCQRPSALDLQPRLRHVRELREGGGAGFSATASRRRASIDRSRTARAVIIPYARASRASSPASWTTRPSGTPSSRRIAASSSSSTQVRPSSTPRRTAWPSTSPRSSAACAPRSNGPRRSPGRHSGSCSWPTARRIAPTERKTLLNEFKGLRAADAVRHGADARRDRRSRRSELLEQARVFDPSAGRAARHRPRKTAASRSRICSTGVALAHRPAALHADRLGAERRCTLSRRAAAETRRERAGVQRREVWNEGHARC